MDIDLFDDRSARPLLGNANRNRSLLSRLKRPMALSFRVRDPQRDTATDKARFEQLSRLVTTLKSDIAAEREGLRARLERDAGDAAFLMHAMESEDASARQNSRVDDLQKAIIYAGQRETELARQLACVGELEDLLEKLDANERG